MEPLKTCRCCVVVQTEVRSARSRRSRLWQTRSVFHSAFRPPADTGRRRVLPDRCGEEHRAAGRCCHRFSLVRIVRPSSRWIRSEERGRSRDQTNGSFESFGTNAPWSGLQWGMRRCRYLEPTQPDTALSCLRGECSAPCDGRALCSRAQEVPQPTLELSAVLHVALPDDADSPACTMKRRAVLPVAAHVRRKLQDPCIHLKRCAK